MQLARGGKGYQKGARLMLGASGHEYVECAGAHRLAQSCGPEVSGAEDRGGYRAIVVAMQGGRL